MCTCTVLTNLPMGLLKLADFHGELIVLRSVVMMIYWSQFCTDFIVYAASNKRYREAYLLLFKTIAGREGSEDVDNVWPLAVIQVAPTNNLQD